MKKGTVDIATRRVCADFTGDEAVDLEILEVSLGIGRIAKSKSDKDAYLLKAAVLALSNAINRYRQVTDRKYPDYNEIVSWMEAGEKLGVQEKTPPIANTSDSGQEVADDSPIQATA